MNPIICITYLNYVILCFCIPKAIILVIVLRILIKCGNKQSKIINAILCLGNSMMVSRIASYSVVVQIMRPDSIRALIGVVLAIVFRLMYAIDSRWVRLL